MERGRLVRVAGFGGGYCAEKVEAEFFKGDGEPVDSLCGLGVNGRWREEERNGGTGGAYD